MPVTISNFITFSSLPTGIGTDKTWSNPSNAAVLDTNYASVILLPSQTSAYLYAVGLTALPPPNSICNGVRLFCDDGGSSDIATDITVSPTWNGWINLAQNMAKNTSGGFEPFYDFDVLRTDDFYSFGPFGVVLQSQCTDTSGPGKPSSLDYLHVEIYWYNYAPPPDNLTTENGDSFLPLRQKYWRFDRI